LHNSLILLELEKGAKKGQLDTFSFRRVANYPLFCLEIKSRP